MNYLINKKPHYFAGFSDVEERKNLFQQHHLLSLHVFTSLYLV